MIKTFLRSIVIALTVCTIGAIEARAQSRTVVIDAGHGGHDRGGVPRQRIGEKGMTLDVAQRLRRLLEADGYRVVMTRTSDVFIPLGQRVRIANSYPGGQFVSIHFNSARRAGANGIETYYYRSSAASLASRIHRNVVSVAPSENRGIRRRGYFVLRRTNIPAVLCELGFLTNPMEGRYALNPSYRQRLAEQIARGIRGQSVGITKPLNPGSRASVEVLPQSIQGADFVRAAPRKRYSKRSKASRKRSRAAQRKRSSKKKPSATIIIVQGQPWPV